MANTIPEGYTLDGYNKKTGRPEFEVSGNVQTVISDILGISPHAKLWSLAMEWEGAFDGTMTDLAECSGIGRTSLYKIIPSFVGNEWIIPSRMDKKVQYYKFNMRNPFVNKMVRLLKDFLNYSVEVEMAMQEAMDKGMPKLLALEKKAKAKKKKKK